jgi:glycosyltransferase involved in cell wall biosynthesis
MKPIVNVIICVYNGEKYITEALSSIFAQTYSPIEVIVINDGSTDRTIHAVEPFFARSLRIYSFDTNQGLASARNKGIELAQGEFIAFIDADDIWLPDKLQLQVDVVDQNPGVEIVNCMVENFISPDLEGEKNIKFIAEATQAGFLGALLIRKSVFKKIGNFKDQGYIGFSDMEWVMRTKQQEINYYHLKSLQLRRRIHGKNMGLTRTASPLIPKLSLLKKKIDQGRSSRNMEE